MLTTSNRLVLIRKKYNLQTPSRWQCLCEPPNRFPCIYWKLRMSLLSPSQMKFLSVFQATSQDPSPCGGECVFVPVCKTWGEVIAGRFQGKLGIKNVELHFIIQEKRQLWGARWSHTWQKSAKGRELFKSSEGGWIERLAFYQAKARRGNHRMTKGDGEGFRGGTWPCPWCSCLTPWLSKWLSLQLPHPQSLVLLWAVELGTHYLWR